MLIKWYILDFYTNKNFYFSTSSDLYFSLWDKCVVRYLDGEKNLTVGIYIWSNHVWIDREVVFESLLTSEESKDFDIMQKKAREHFLIFKTMFKKSFSDAIPVTSRYHIFSRQWYFYFYGEQRYQFGDFLRQFRQEFGQQFFLYQVGARDMIKMSPATDDIVWCNGQNLCCKSHRPLPSIDVEHLLMQHLEWRDIERLKWRCGKLKCSLIYEIETYILENKEFPQKWSKIEYVTPLCEKCGMVTNYNIMTRKIDITTDDGTRVQVDLDQIKKIYDKKENLW